ncbi:hypothetical protein D3C86_2142820 [compost metagenome]
MRVDLGFKRFHLRVHGQNFILVALPDKGVDVLHHFVVFRIQEADFIDPLGFNIRRNEFL